MQAERVLNFDFNQGIDSTSSQSFVIAFWGIKWLHET